MTRVAGYGGVIVCSGPGFIQDGVLDSPGKLQL